VSDPRHVSANENTMDRNKSTIMPDDVFKALHDTEFSFLVEPLKAEYESVFLRLLSQTRHKPPFHHIQLTLSRIRQ
jgi:hypothetical protein